MVNSHRNTNKKSYDNKIFIKKDWLFMNNSHSNVHIGDRYNHLVVVGRAENHKTPSGALFSAWFCKCDCGRTVVVLGSSLRSGHTKSCGCLSKQPKTDDSVMLNRKFGKLLVVSRAPSHRIPSGSVYDMWHCVCDCGNKTVSFGRNLRKGTTVSCGCDRSLHMLQADRKPKAEIWLEEYFGKQNIEYVCEKTFPGLCSESGRSLAFDFYLPDMNVLIELNGLQHYQPVEWFGGADGFAKQVKHDSQKQDFASEHGYRLLSIPTNHISKKRLISIIQSLL